ncbi:GumC family protein [Mongoliitalea daihaiensis]|uniref:GumC family protein n=1 Tax=Mongoliitalea daihaiensis TaxID=2782006 RepID=UPI001F3317B4|nr:tyrosine-protein kinase family protein [Mongoliitalea daihaiensis]UJP64910.1 polysaccharide biosynthesis tyrosine autokinase [Mongoliitalea daihaiensis]
MNKYQTTDENAPAFDPFKFIIKYFKYWPYVAVSIVIALGIAFYINQTTPAIYQASAKFFIKEEDNSAGILNLTGLPRALGGRVDYFVNNQVVFLKSRPVVERSLMKLKFDVDYFQPGLLKDIDLYTSSPIQVEVDWEGGQILADKIKISWNDSENFTVSFPGSNYFKYVPGVLYEEIELDNSKEFKHKFGELTDSQLYKFTANLVNNAPQGEILIELRTIGSLVNQYSGDNLIVYPIENMSTMLGLSINTTHPKKGTDFLNSLMETFLEIELEDKNRMASRTVEFIDFQIAGVSDTLSYFEDNLQSFRSQNRTYNVASESGTVFQQITSLESELSKERFYKNYFDEVNRYLGQGSLDKIIAPAGIGIEDKTLNSLVENLIDLQSQRAFLLTTQTEASPRVRDLSKRIGELTGSIQEIVKNLSRNAQLKMEDLDARIRSSERQFSRLPGTEQNLIRIERGKVLNEAIYNFLQQRRAEAAISMASNFSTNKIVELARAGSDPIKTRQTAVYVIFFALGFIIPVVGITIFELSNTKIKDPQELEEKLTIPLMAKIPATKLGSDLEVINNPRSITSESFRALKTNISFIVPRDQQLTIAVSSTLSGEGKTFTAMNLASIYALNEKKTLLIGCDMFKPNAMKDFQLDNQIGLSNYLSKQSDSLFELIQPTNVPLFDVISSGPIPPNPSDLMASPRFLQLIDELKNIYEVIILDTPPVGLISQSFEVIKHVDLFVYVLRHKISEKSFIADVNKIKVQKGINSICAVLNGVPEKMLVYKGYMGSYYEPSKTGKSYGLKKIKERTIS